MREQGASGGAADARLPASPFSIPIYRKVWAANLISNFGGMIQSVGAAWLMTSLTSSREMVALVQSSNTLPIMLLSVWSGAVADNLDRRRVMLCAQGFMLVVSVTLALCAWSGALTPWLLLAFTFLVGCGTALNAPAWQASVGDMVPKPLLPGAVAFNSMGFNTARSAGPAVGGAIVAAFGSAAAFLVNALSYVGLIAVLARWRPVRPPRLLPRERMGDAMRAGLRYVAMSPNLRTVLMRALLFGVSASAIPSLMPVVARQLITGGALVFGALLGAFGMGAVGGAFISTRLRRKLASEQLVRIASLALAVGTVTTGLSGTLIVTLPALLCAGAGWVLVLSTFNVTVQMMAPRWVVARGLALYQMAAFGGMATGSWFFGFLADHQGLEVSFFTAAGFQIVGVLVGLRWPLPPVEDLNLDPLSGWKEPRTEVLVEPDGGPIVVTIEYRIAETSIAEFLDLMNERRRIRRRDGAREWSLSRDLGDREAWIESYSVPTWVDYVRHNQRRTKADAANSDRIRALHRADEPPIVHRRIEWQTSSVPLAQAQKPPDAINPLDSDSIKFAHNRHGG